MIQAWLAAPLLITTIVNDAPRPNLLQMSPPMTREDIKAAREKSDRDMKLDTKRPWDGMNLKTFTSGEPEVPSKPKDKTE